MFRKELDVAKKAAKLAGETIMKYYRKIDIKLKSNKTLVTEADIESEKLIRKILSENFPEYSIWGEEFGKDEKTSKLMWIIDPLDGTTNFVIENPFFNVSIALVKDKTPVLGVVYYPFQDELFFAVKGKGSYLNDNRIVVSKIESIEDSVITFCHSSDKEATLHMAEIWKALKLRNPKVRQIGAAALEMSYVASGRVDAFMMIKQNPWDVSAGAIIVEEASGKVTDFDGDKFDIKKRDILATNGKLHHELLEIINECKTKINF